MAERIIATPEIIALAVHRHCNAAERDFTLDMCFRRPEVVVAAVNIARTGEPMSEEGLARWFLGRCQAARLGGSS